MISRETNSFTTVHALNNWYVYSDTYIRQIMTKLFFFHTKLTGAQSHGSC